MYMVTLTEVTKELGKFGLSVPQARIYISLVEHGELRIQEITTKTGIPRTSVYEHLKVLSQVGLIEKIIDQKFVRIKPYPISNVRHALNEKLFRIQTLLTDVTQLEKTMKQFSSSIPSSATTVRYYKGVSGARQVFWNSLSAKSTVYVYSEYGRPKYVGKKFYTDFVRESKVQNIREKVLINPTPRVQDLLKIYLESPETRTKKEDIHTIEETDVLIKGETFIYDNIYAQVYIYTGDINGFEIESSLFVKTQRSIFETLWKTTQSL